MMGLAAVRKVSNLFLVSTKTNRGRLCRRITGSLSKHDNSIARYAHHFHKYLQLAQFSIPIASFFAVNAIDDRAEDGLLRRRFRVHLHGQKKEMSQTNIKK